MFKVLKILIISLLLFSCSTQREIIEVPIETTRIEYINQSYRDSIFVQDSIDRYISGDTVYQYKYKYMYKYITKTDTIVKTDSIQIPVKIREVAEVNKLKWYQELFMYLGMLLIAIGIFKLGGLFKSKFI